MHITHHFTPGLRFDALWKYAIRTPAGRARWARLPLGQAECVVSDPHGAWWCARRCAAVLRREAWQSVNLPPGLPLQPESGKVALALNALVPRCQVVLNDSAAQAPLRPCTDALLAGGSALLQLQSDAL